ncbi:MAG: hypothetical protein GKR91_00195 [Pseudomonadales bacterium]|nr:hypothetical protein [Pseudomonadales bacterium]
MKKVLIIDGGQGESWTTLQSLQLNHYDFSRTEDWDEVFDALVKEELALLLVSLDSDQNNSTKILEFQSRNTATPVVPILVVSREQERLTEIVKLDCPHIEL